MVSKRKKILLPSPRCALVCVGSELLRGKLNTHAGTIARRLQSIGLTLNEEHTVTDDLSDITRGLRHVLEQADVVFMTGGLGPTFDDLSREAASEVTGRALKTSPALERNIVAKFRRAKYTMPATNRRQALLLEGAEPIDNSNGTAPGQFLEFSQKILILLPGPPRELNPMLDDSVLPLLARRFKAAPQAEAHIHFVGLAESVVDAKIRPIIDAAQREHKGRIDFTILAHLGLVDFDIFVSASDLRTARQTLERVVAKIKKIFGDSIYGRDQAFPLEKVVGETLRQLKATVAVAESCTGGLLASRLTALSGSSEFFIGGLVTYHNSAKERLLSVPAQLLATYGAVSAEVARAMAQGVRSVLGSTYGVAITGVAGPNGGTPEKPVGLVFVALASPKTVSIKKLQLSGDRDVIRQRAVLSVLDLLRQL